MKNIIKILSVIIFFLAGCGKEEPPYEAVNPIAFAYDLGNGWEVNSSVVVKGFKTNQMDNQFTSKLSFNVDIVTPAGDTIKNISSGVRDHISEEKPKDLSLESQFELDSTYVSGKYKIIFKIKDEITTLPLVEEKEFDITADD
jgi:uncharacterized lipoprotein YajG